MTKNSQGTGQTITITREGLLDGSLIRAARLRAPPGTTLLTDAEIEASLDTTLASLPPGEDAWLFGYGSLMWNPAIRFAERLPARVRGWNRGYCLWLPLGRGTPDNPGLMLALDRGGRCAGVALRIRAAEARNELLLAWRREMFTGAYTARWVRAETGHGTVRAVTFVANRHHPRYAGRLDEAVIAARIALAAGPLGSCATYLAETIAALHALGLNDRGLERLQRRIGPRAS